MLSGAARFVPAFGLLGLLASSAAAQVFFYDTGLDYDGLSYAFSGSLGIVGGTVREFPSGPVTPTAGDVVSFTYQMDPGPEQWVERIHDIEYRSVTYAIQDPARLLDPWILDPSEIEVYEGGLTFGGASGEVAGALSGLKFTVSYGAHALHWSGLFGFGAQSFIPDGQGNVRLPEFVIAGLLSGETVSIEIFADPYYNGQFIEAPFTYDFQSLLVDTTLRVYGEVGGLAPVPEPAVISALVGLVATLPLLRRRRR